MIKELTNFIKSLDPGMKMLGMKPKEGLHILLRIQKEEDQVFIDEQSIVQTAFIRKKDQTPEEVQFLKRCANLIQLSWCVNTNKCFDLPIKAIHSCSPYCLAVKKENLTGGEKYKENTKSKVYERISSYFAKASELLETDEEKQMIKVFEQAFNSEEKFNAWLTMCPEYEQLKDSEYVIFYLDVPLSQYEATNARYLADKLFNTNEYNKTVAGEIFGTSDFFNGYPTKKPFLSHQSASFDIAARISAEQAKHIFEFQDIMTRNILPKPLPIFIHQDEIMQKAGRSLEDSAMAIFKREAEKEDRDSRIGYREIIQELYEKHGDELGNYYLLFYDRGEIKDFDFVPKFDYLLCDEKGEKWAIEDLFNGGNDQSIKNVFHFQQVVLLLIFNNGLVVKTKAGGFQYKYFNEIDSKYTKSDATYLHILQYRKAFYDFIYKSKRQAVTAAMFDSILRTSVLEDIRLDEIKSSYHTEDRNIRKKLNIWFSLKENFNQSSHKNNETMANKLKEHREFIKKLVKSDVDIENDEQYAFAAGQVIYYLMSKSKTADRSYKRLEPFLQQVQAKQLNMAISRMFDCYKHEQFSGNFKTPFAQVVAYDTSKNMRDLIPTLLSGIFSKNSLFSDKEYEDVITVDSEEETDN
jgi:CRISPR-associated protein Csh1